MIKFKLNKIEQIIPIRGFMGCCHLVLEKDRKSAILIDTGLYGEYSLIKLKLKMLKLNPDSIKAIILTHGHLDHSGNLKVLKELTGAKVYAHPLEQEIIDGCYPYKGVNRWCGRLENLGRKLLGVGKPTPIDQPITNGDTLPHFDGLEVLHLPGHTLGHCGFYSKAHDLLFSGDLFSSYAGFSHLPPPILNTKPEQIKQSIEKVAKLNPKYIIPNHYDLLMPEIHKKRFLNIHKKITNKV
jgi:glyoxylase-like metal-dependent hydrolase (beta-lactamase superfamily II)